MRIEVNLKRIPFDRAEPTNRMKKKTVLKIPGSKITTLYDDKYRGYQYLNNHISTFNFNLFVIAPN